MVAAPWGANAAAGTMTLKQLSTFYWICRLGGFASAAEHLHTTQSAVSIRMQELENSLSVELFDRSHRTARLTARGKALLKYAERLMTIASEIQHRISDPQKLTGLIGLGATEMVAISWLPTLVAAIHEKCPGIVLRLDVDAAINQIAKLERGTIDITIIPGPIDDPRYTAVSVGSIEFEWMASPALNISRKTLAPKDLQQWPLLTLAADSMSHKQLDRWFEENNATIDRWDTCNSLGVLAALAGAGLGVSYLPHGYFDDVAAVDKLQVLNVKPKLPGLEYFIIFETRLAEPVSHVIAELAQQHSTFRSTKASGRQARPQKRKRGRPSARNLV
jgi:DNA-binding transcriptional LysR family regulator